MGTARPTDANVYYYLGEILWNMDQKAPALAAWKTAAEHNPKHALALRCIGFAISHPGTYFTNTGIPSGVASREAYDWYVKSLEAVPHFRTLDEAGKLAEKLDLPAAERLALMEKYLDTVNKYDPCILRLAYTYNAVARQTPVGVGDAHSGRKRAEPRSAVAESVRKRTQRRYRLKFADSHYGEMAHYGLHRLATARTRI